MFLKNNNRPLEEVIAELTSQHELLEEEARKLFEEIGMAPEQVDAALNDPGRFDEETLRQIEKERARQDLLFPSNRESSAPSSPSQKRRALGRAAGWIFVR